MSGTVSDRFREILIYQREVFKSNLVASKISEMRIERRELLDDVVRAVNKWKYSKQAERNEWGNFHKNFFQSMKLFVQLRCQERDVSLQRAKVIRPCIQKRYSPSDYDDLDREPTGKDMHARKVFGGNVKGRRNEAIAWIIVLYAGGEPLKLVQEKELRRIQVDWKRFQLEEFQLLLDSKVRNKAILERKEVRWWKHCSKFGRRLSNFPGSGACRRNDLPFAHFCGLNMLFYSLLPLKISTAVLWDLSVRVICMKNLEKFRFVSRLFECFWNRAQILLGCADFLQWSSKRYL